MKSKPKRRRFTHRLAGFKLVPFETLKPDNETKSYNNNEPVKARFIVSFKVSFLKGFETMKLTLAEEVGK